MHESASWKHKEAGRGCCCVIGVRVAVREQTRRAALLQASYQHKALQLYAGLQGSVTKLGKSPNCAEYQPSRNKVAQPWHCRSSSKAKFSQITCLG
ncbi:hypothetical protein MHYP_G00353040 [Metynnis hypsauchen]